MLLTSYRYSITKKAEKLIADMSILLLGKIEYKTAFKEI